MDMIRTMSLLPSPISCLSLPSAFCAGCVMIFALCGCYRCFACRLRDWCCVRRCFRCCGHDAFDDFDMMILVHEATFTQFKKDKVTTFVKVTAGAHHVSTDASSQSVFQQPLTCFVEQGAETILIELFDHRERILGSLKLDTVKDIIEKAKTKSLADREYVMKPKGKGISNPKVRLSIVLDQGEDLETGLLANHTVSNETAWVLKQQILEARQRLGIERCSLEDSDLKVMCHACAGPLDLFQGLGNADTVYIGVLGPHSGQRKYALGVWPDQEKYEANAKPTLEVDLMRIRNIQPDPERANVFQIFHTDAEKATQALHCRRIDRARDAWVEMLQLLVKLVHAEAEGKKRVGTKK